CRSARSSTVASASPGSTTCTCTYGASPSIATSTARPPSTASGSRRCCSPRSRRWPVSDQPARDLETESVDAFRLRARAWLADHMPRRALDAPPPDRAEDEQTWVRDRELQHVLWDGGFTGICFPKEYGGLGLTIEHQHAFTEESLPYEMPLHLNVPNF